MRNHLNQRGQGLIEYLVIVAIIAIGSIAIVRTLGNTVYVRFGNIANALQNKTHDLHVDQVKPDEIKKKGLDDFFRSSVD